MTPTPVERLVSLHGNIVAERESLLARLRAIDEALAAMGINATMRYYGLHTPAGRARNQLPLKKTVLQILAKRALTKEQLLKAVLSTGYQFTTDNPLNSLGVVLYGKTPRFKNINGRLSL